MYDTSDYAEQRLGGTIISYDGVPVRVLNCRGNMDITVEVTYLSNGNYKEVKLKDLDITPVKLGFVNSAYGIGYLGRIPLRKDWKQGLRQNSLRSMWGIDARWVSEKELHNCIVGSYPKFERALEEVVNSGVPVAFNRHFALSLNNVTVMLLYKWHGEVGDVVNGKPQLKDEYSFLNESLDEVMKGN